MDFQTILPFILPTIVSFLTGLSSSFLPKLLDNKYTPLILRVFEVLDPILAGNTKAYGGSGVRKIIGETILAITDRQLSPAEVAKIIDLTLKLFDPAIAADQPETRTSQVVAEAIARTDGNLSDLDLTGIRFKFPVS